MTREELIQSIQRTSQDIQNAYLVDKAAKLDARANEKLQKLSGITGLYDADSPTIPTYTNPLTGKPTNTTRITADDYYVQAPELKDANRQLTQAGINARIQADNYAMGVDAPNFLAGEGLEPQYYQQYVDAMNPAIQERNQAGTYNIADTGSIDKYGRKLVQAQSTEMPMSQTDYLLSKEQGKKVLLQPSSESGLRDYFIQNALGGDEKAIEDKSYWEQIKSLPQAIGAGMAKSGYDVADAWVDVTGDVGGRLVGLIDPVTGKKIDKYVDLGTDEQKTERTNELLGYDDSFTKANIQKVKEHWDNAWEKFNIIKPSTWSTVDAGEIYESVKDAFQDIETAGYSLGYMLPAMAGVTGRAAKDAVGGAVKTHIDTVSDNLKEVAKGTLTKEKAQKAAAESLKAMSKRDRVKLFLVNHADALQYGVISNNNQLDEYIENNGGEDATVLRAILGTAANAIGMKLDIGLMNSIVKGEPGRELGKMVGDILKGAGESKARQFMGVVTEFGIKAGVAGLKEFPQEYSQTFIEEFNKIYGTKKEDGTTVGLGEATRTAGHEAGVGAVMGLAGGTQTSAAAQLAKLPGNMLNTKKKDYTEIGTDEEVSNAQVNEYTYENVARGTADSIINKVNSISTTKEDGVDKTAEEIAKERSAGVNELYNYSNTLMNRVYQTSDTEIENPTGVDVAQKVNDINELLKINEFSKPPKLEDGATKEEIESYKIELQESEEVVNDLKELKVEYLRKTAANFAEAGRTAELDELLEKGNLSKEEKEIIKIDSIAKLIIKGSDAESLGGIAFKLNMGTIKLGEEAKKEETPQGEVQALSLTGFKNIVLKDDNADTTEIESAKDTQPKKEAKAESTIKEKVKTKLEPADNTRTDTHIVGISSRTVNKIAKAIGVDATKLKIALNTAVREIRVKDMKNSGKEANKIQYETYYNEKTGIVPTFSRLRNAVATGDKENAKKESSALVKKSVQIQKRLAKYDLVYDEMYSRMLTHVNSTINDPELKSYIKSVPDESVAPMEVGEIEGTKEGKVHKVKLKDVLNDVLIDMTNEGKISKELAEELGVDKMKKSTTRDIMEAQEESRMHIEELLDSVNIVAPVLNSRVVSAEEEVTRKESVIAKLEEELNSKKLPEETRKAKLVMIETIKNEIEQTKKAGRKLKMEVAGNEVDFDEYFDSVSGLELDQVLKKGENYVKLQRANESETMKRVSAVVQGIQEGKDAAELDIAEEVEETTKVLDPAAVEQTIKDIKELEGKRTIESQVVDRRADRIKKIIENKQYKLDAELKSELEGFEDIYNKAQIEIEGMYTEINSLSAEKQANTNLINAIKRIRANSTDIDKDIADIEKALEANKDMNKKGTVLGTLVKMYEKTKDSLKLVDKVMKWVGYKSKENNPKTRIAKLIAEIDERNAEIDRLISVKRVEVKTEKQELRYEIGAERSDRIVKISKKLKILNRRKSKLLRSNTAELRLINNALNELKSKLKNKTRVNQIAKNNIATLDNIETNYNEWVASDKNLLNKNKKDKIQPEWQPVNMFTSGIVEIKNSVVGALGIKEIGYLLEEEDATLLSELRKTVETGVNEHIDLQVIQVKTSTLVNRLFQNPAYGLAVNENGVVNDAFIDAVTLVSADFIANGLHKLNFKTAEDIARMLELNSPFEVTKEMKKLFTRSGSFEKVLAYSLGKAVARNMGISPTENMSEDHWNKLVAGLGDMTLRSLQDKYVQPLDNTTIPMAEYLAAIGKTESGDKSEVKIPMVKSMSVTDSELDAMRKLSKSLNDELDIFGVTENYHLDKPRDLENKKYDEVRGGVNIVPEKQQKVMRKLEGEASQLNMDGMSVLEEMAPDREAMLGMLKDYKNTEELNALVEGNKITQDAYDSQISRNRELENAVDELLDLRDKIKAGGILNRLYFRWFFSKNGRFFIDSAGINPQTEKLLHRWLVTSMESERTWNLKDAEDGWYFKVSVVQAFDGSEYGGGIDKMTEKSVIAAYDKIMKLSDKELLEVAKTAAHPGHAALAIAGIRKAKKGDKFTATMLIEYDAVTSGFILKLLQTPILKNDEGDGKLKEWISKGGVFEGNDRRIDGKGTADLLGELDDGKADVTIVDSYKTQGHLIDVMAKEEDLSNNVIYENGVLVFKVGLAVESYGDKKDLVNIDKLGLVQAIQADGLIEAIFDTNKDDKKIIIETSLDAKGNKVVGPKMTKFGRDLFKPGFMTFNYGSSLASIEKHIGEALAELVMNKLLKEDAPREASDAIISKVFKAKTMKDLALEFRAVKEGEKEPNRTKVSKLLVGGQMTETDFQETLAHLLSKSYGTAITTAMASEFGELIELNNAMINTTKVMFRLWKKDFDKEVSELGHPATFKDLTDIFAKLHKKFPLIKGPASEGELDRVAIYTTSTAGYDSRMLGNAQVAVKNDENKLVTRTIQLMTKQLAEAHAAGAVIPIHWIDGTVIGEVLQNFAGVLGVHDAIVLGKLFTESVKDMNRATAEIGRDYDLTSALMESLMESLEGVTDNELNEVLNPKADESPSFAEVITEMIKQHNIVQQARKEFYSRDHIVGNIAGHKGTTYELKAITEVNDGIIKEKSGITKMSVAAMQEILQSVIEGCK